MSKTKSTTERAADLIRASDAKKIAQDFTPKRAKKSKKVFITPELEKKEKLTLREKLWVYNSVVALGLGFVNLIMVAAVGMALDPKGGIVGTLLLIWGIGGVLLLLLGLGETQHRMMSSNLSFERRKMLKFAERQRTKTGHALERYDRYGGEEVNYNHFSVRVESEGRRLKLTIVEHKKLDNDKYMDEVVALNDLERIRLLVPQAVSAYEVQYEKYESGVEAWRKEHDAWVSRKLNWTQKDLRHFGNKYVDETGDLEPVPPEAPAAPTGQMAIKYVERGRGESMEDFERKVDHWKGLFDQIAAAFEQQAYEKAREEIEVKMLALRHRN